MQISVRTRYAMCALIDLNINQSRGNIKLKDVSERQNIPLKYLEQIIQALNKAGLVKGERGPNGGYVLSRSAEDISVEEVLLALEGSTGIESSFDQQFIDLDGCAQRAVYTFWKEMETMLREKTFSTSIADLSKDVHPEAGLPSSDEYYI